MARPAEDIILTTSYQVAGRSITGGKNGMLLVVATGTAVGIS